MLRGPGPGLLSTCLKCAGGRRKAPHMERLNKKEDDSSDSGVGFYLGLSV